MRSVRRAAQTTRKPCAARARAVAAPMPLEAPVTTAVRDWVLSMLMRPSCQDPVLTRLRGDHRGGRRFGTRQPRPGRLGVVRRRRLLGVRRLAARHQQHGRADGGPRPAPADRAPRRRAARLLRQQVRHRLGHQVDAGLEAQGLEEERRQARAERRADEGARRRHGGPARHASASSGSRATPATSSTRRPTSAPTPPRRPTSAVSSPTPARASPAAAPPTRPRRSGRSSRSPTCSATSTTRPGRWSRPTRSTSSPWSGRC